MSVEMEKLEHNMAKFTIRVSDEDFEKALDRAYKKDKNRISIPAKLQIAAQNFLLVSLDFQSIIWWSSLPECPLLPSGR